MKHSKITIVIFGLTALLVHIPATATYNATVIGTISTLQQMGTNVGYTAETTTFSLTNQPSTLCSAGYRQFSISPATITDAQTRRNMIAMLLLAKASGASIQVAYDMNNNGYCDQGMPGVYYITVMP